MAQFTYTAMDAKGTEKSGTIEAESQSAVISKLRETGLFPTNVIEIGSPSKKDKKNQAAGSQQLKAIVAPGAPKGKVNLNMDLNIAALWGGSGVAAKELCVFTRQLATLVDAGLPLLRGLTVLMRQEKNATLKRVLGELGSAVEAGSTFSEALSLHPKVFNNLYVSMVKAGEVGGVLEVVLNRLAQFMEKAEKIKGKVKAAMFYPIAVLIIAVGILTFLMVFIVPKFQDIFKDMLEGEKLPDFTELVLGFSSHVKDNIFYILGFIIAYVVGIKMFAKTPYGRLFLDKFWMRAPLVGDLVQKTSIARFTRTLGTLVASGVPILQSLTIVREASGSRVISDAVGKIHESVKEGESIVQPLEASRAFPPMVISMVDVGETTGALPAMLMKIADNYEEEVDNSVTALVSLLEPIMIVLLAFIVGSIVIALFLPLIRIITKMSGDSGGGGSEK